MKKILVLFLTMASLGAFAQELPPDELLQILTDNSSEQCLVDEGGEKKLCDCSKQAHLAATHQCVTGGCCNVEASTSTGDASTSCEATVGTNSEKFDAALQAIEDAKSSDQ
jgi:hypothetical protein